MKQLFTNKKYIFLAIVVVFFITRFWGILDYPIFNDESLYVQYSQLMHDDFSANKYISVNNGYGDWKPPMQYWLGAFFIDLFENPLLSVRVLSVLFSLVGLYGAYLLGKKMYGEKEGIVSAILYLISSLTIFYNTQFVAETFVFSAGIFFLACVAGSIKRRDGEEPKVRFIIGAILAGALLTLFKQSGALYLYISPLFLLLSFCRKNTKEKKIERQSRVKELFFRNLGVVAGIILLSLFLSSMFIPAEFMKNKDQFTGRWTFGISDVLSFPIDVWSSNIKTVSALFSHYYSWGMLALVLWFVVRAFYKRDLRDITTSLLWIAATSAVVLFLSGFNEYMYHTATIPFLILILARASVYAGKYARRNDAVEKALPCVVGVLVIFTAGYWIYQSVFMKISPVSYLAHSTAWAKSNYLTGWSSGFGIPDVVDFLKEHGRSLVIVDPQWGNPGTSIQVFQRRQYPDSIVFPIYANFFDAGYRQEIKDADIENRFVIFSDWTNEGVERNKWYQIVMSEFCKEKISISKYEEQTPIAICKF